MSLDNNMFLYEELSEETVTFLKKAIDIYSAIKNREINKIVQLKSFSFETTNYHFSDVDKRIISLFLASLLVDNGLNNILKKYDDIRKEDVFDFIELNPSDIKELSEDEYRVLYNQGFKSDLKSVVKEYSDAEIFTCNEIKPEVIYLFQDQTSLNSKILDYFFRNYTSSRYFSAHESLPEVKREVIKNGSIKPKKKERPNPYIEALKKLCMETEEVEILDKQVTENETIKYLNDDTVWDILDSIQRKFIGQEIVVEQLFYNIINNQYLAQSNDVMDGERSIIFLDGPSGTGKTAIIREITDKLDIPFAATSITKYSATGYEGGNLTDLLENLVKKANGNVEKAQRGIIILDEFDKISYKSECGDGLGMKKAVQQQLLDFMGGGKYTINVGTNVLFSNQVEFDTSKLTFACLGALTDLRTQKQKRKQPLGFISTTEEDDISSYSITPQDLIEIVGFEKELVARFNTYLHTDEYSKETLTRILKESPLSPLVGFDKLVSSKGKKLELDDGVCEAVADAAYNLNTGARSLQTVMNNVRTFFLKEIIRGTEETIHIDVDTVTRINESTFNRKGRK